MIYTLKNCIKAVNSFYSLVDFEQGLGKTLSSLLLSLTGFVCKFYRVSKQLFKDNNIYTRHSKHSKCNNRNFGNSCKICSKQRSHLLEKSLMENFFFVQCSFFPNMLNNLYYRLGVILANFTVVYTSVATDEIVILQNAIEDLGRITNMSVIGKWILSDDGKYNDIFLDVPTYSSF